MQLALKSFNPCPQLFVVSLHFFNPCETVCTGVFMDHERSTLFQNLNFAIQIPFTLLPFFFPCYPPPLFLLLHPSFHLRPTFFSDLLFNQSRSLLRGLQFQVTLCSPYLLFGKSHGHLVALLT